MRQMAKEVENYWIGIRKVFKLGAISGFLFVIFLSVLYDLIRREKGEIPFFPVNTVCHPSHCAPFLPSLPSVCSSFSTAACFCLSFKLLFIMLYIPSHLIESILPCTVFGTFLLLKLRIPQRLPTPPPRCSFDSQQDVAFVDCWPA